MSISLSLLLSLSTPGLLQASTSEDPRTLAVTDLAHVQRITELDLAADGQSAVVAIRSIHGDVAAHEGDTGYRSHLFHLDLTEEAPELRPLTHGARVGYMPALSPDGSLLAFAREGEEPYEGAGRLQLWVLPLDGPGEARQLTALEQGATNPRWLGDAGRLLVSTSVELDELEATPPWDELRPGRDWEPLAAGSVEEGEDAEAEQDAGDPDGDLADLRRWLDAGAEEGDPVSIARLAFQGERGLRGAETVSRLALVDLDAQPEDELELLDTGFFDAGGAAPSSDGTWAVFSDRADQAQHPDESRRSALWRVDLGSGDVAALYQDPEASLGSPRLQPDGAGLWFTSRRVDEPTFANTELRYLQLETSRLRTLAAGADAHTRSLRVDGDGSAWVLFPKEGRSLLHNVRLDDRGNGPATGASRELTPGARPEEPSVLGADVLAMDVGAGRVLAAVSSADDPSYLVLRTLEDDARVVARPNAELLDGLSLSTPTVHWLDRPDGTRVQYWVLPALGVEAGASAPVVLSLHGGPHVMWGAGSHTMWHEWQWMAALGYTVVFANPRGSDGYGYAHRKGNYRDWGHGPAGDVLACLEETLARDPEGLDAERLYLTGGSYAGYLTAWIVGQDQRFRAAVAQRGVYDLVTFFGEGNAWRLVEYSFGGLPWDPDVRGILVRESPFTYVESMETPLLILHASQDLRTGVSQSEMLYRALQELDRPVEYVRYPGEGHDLSRTGNPRRRVDRLLRIVEFFGRF